MILACRVILQDYVIKGSCDSMDRCPWWLYELQKNNKKKKNTRNYKVYAFHANPIKKCIKELIYEKKSELMHSHVLIKYPHHEKLVLNFFSHMKKVTVYCHIKTCEPMFV